MSTLFLFEEVSGVVVLRDILERWTSAKLVRNLTASNTLEMKTRDADLPSEIDVGWLIGAAELASDTVPNRLFRVDKIDGATGNGTLGLYCIDASGLFPARPVEPPSGVTHDTQTSVVAETAMHHYVNAWAGPGAPTNRRIPYFVMGANLARGPLVTFNARYMPLSDVLEAIAFPSGLGWDVLFNLTTKQQSFVVTVGVDRTNSVVFSMENDSLADLTWLKSDTDRVTYAIVGGQGEGTARNIQKRWWGQGQGIAEPTGWDWRGTFIDAADVSTSDGLIARADSYIAKHGPQVANTVTVNPDGAFKYRRDWDVGDIVTLVDLERHISAIGRVMKVELSMVADGDPEVAVSIGRPYPSLEDVIEQAQTFEGRARS